MLVHRFLEESAARTPDADALIEPHRSISYIGLEQLANKFAHVLIDAGVCRGDRVVIAMDNCVELVAAYIGSMKAGAAAVPLPSGPRSDRLATAVADCSPSACIVDAATLRDGATRQALERTPAVFIAGGKPSEGRSDDGGRHCRVDLAEALGDAPDSQPAVRPIDLDLAAIIYTSGSTGEARGVMLTHRNIVANTRSIISYLQLTAADRVMCVLPFYYVYGLSLLHTHLAVGASVVIDNRFAFPNAVLLAMQRRHVTGFAGVPSTFALLLHRSDIDSMVFPSLRYVTQAGGAMPPARIVEWLERGPKVPLYVMYGTTEASARLTYLEPSLLRQKLGSIGRPIPNVEIVVVKEDGTRARPGETGELVARGGNIARGYWNNPEETAQRFGPLGYRTGDLGYADDEGYLFLVGRLHDMIKVGAHRVGAKEIEDVVSEFPGVHEVAVVAAPDEILGEIPIAYLSVRSELPNAGDVLRAFCANRLPPHKVPGVFVIRGELPKSSVGKIDKLALRREAEHNRRAAAR